MPRVATTYTEDAQAAAYWHFQRQYAELGGELNRWKFEPYVGDDVVVCDFGCGVGCLLAGLPAKDRLGVEPNGNARAEAERRGIRTVANAADLETSSVDIVISNSSLEHALEPFAELRELHRALRPNGLAALNVPSTDWRLRSERYPHADDQNHEFYSWTPQLFWNLLTEAGFKPVSVELRTHAWHPRITPRLRWLPRRLYDLHAWALAAALKRREVFAVATKIE